MLHYSGFGFWRLQQLTDNGESSARVNAALNGNWDEMRIQGVVAKQANYESKNSVTCNSMQFAIEGLGLGETFGVSMWPVRSILSMDSIFPTGHIETPNLPILGLFTGL